MALDSNAVKPEGEPEVRLVAMPADANIDGNVFGGWIMSQLDVAGGIAAMRRAKGRVTTVSARIDFERPIRVGDLVSVYARVLRCGATSVTVSARAFAEPRAGSLGEGESAASAELVYVALDEEGGKRELPSSG